MSLVAALRVERRPRFVLDVALTAERGDVIALLGPNGAGKSTVLRCLAGLEPGLDGRVDLGGATLDDTAAGVRTPPERRPVGVVFQDYLLFPHMSALANVAFGLRARGVPKQRAHATAMSWLDRVGLAEVAAERPRRLSGGQAQRVALARALAVQPHLLLLDEPLAALDAATRLTVRVDLRRHLVDFGGIALVVTHDPIDAMVLADRVIVLEEGRIVQDGSPVEVARSPRTEYVARLVGLNLVRGRAAGHDVALVDGGHLTLAESGEGDVLVAFPPVAVALYPDRPAGSPRNAWLATVDGFEQYGDVVRVRLSGDFPVLADVTPAAIAELRLAPGSSVWAVAKATELRAYPV